MPPKGSRAIMEAAGLSAGSDMHPACQSTVGQEESGLAWGALSEGLQDSEDPLRTSMAELVPALRRPCSRCFTNTKLKP